LAFSTIQGSGGAPDSFVGTTGVDTIAIIDTSANFFLGAQGDNDIISFTSSAIDAGVVSNATLRGGSGIDTFGDLGNTIGFGGRGTLFNGVWFNGNANDDTFTLSLLSGSTVQGGQGDDTMNIAGVGSSLVNGNKNDDTITVGGGTSSSVFGGQGDDTILLTGDITSSSVAGGKGDDTINTDGNYSIVGTSFDGGEGNDTIDLTRVTTAANGGVSISGGDGNDVLTGTGGADTVDGGAGNDLINGEGGADRMSGGGGSNEFVIDSTETGNVATGAIDLITDWTSSDFISGTAFGTAINATFTAVDYAAALTAAAGQVSGTYLFAVGTGTSFTAYILQSTGTAVSNAVQVGQTGAFISSASALASVTGTQLVA
jgi:Ca2+-binding RTX toxin-like protein